MRLLCVVSALAFFASQYTDSKTRVEVFWISPSVEFQSAITPENIEEAASKIVYIRDEGQSDQILRLITKSNQTFNPKSIRVKIKTATKFYNIDSDGIGVSSTGEAVRIDFKKLKEVLCE